MIPMCKQTKNVYSTDERKVGTWIDRKTLYRKVINCGHPNNNSEKLISTNITSCDCITRIDGILIKSDKDAQFKIPYITDTKYLKIDVMQSGTKIRILTNDTWDNYTAYAILEYTKTTD